MAVAENCSMSLPNEEIVIRLSKWKVVWFAAMVLVMIGGVFSLLQGGGVLQYVMSVISILVGAMLSYQGYLDLLELNKPQLIINRQGITANDGEFYPWQDISNEKLVPLGSVKPTWFLWFETPVRNRKLHLTGLGKSPEQILALIKDYRQANTTKNRTAIESES